MAQQATTLGYPYFEGTDTPAGHSQQQTLAEFLDLNPGIGSFTQTQINAFTVGEKRAGRVVYNSTTGKVQVSNGSSFSDVSITEIVDGSITTAKLADSSVTSAKIVDGTIASGDLADSAVTTAKINDAAVTSIKIVDAGVTTAKINDSAVTTGKINDGAVTTAKLADSSVTSAKIVDGTIVNADINASAAIAQSKIADLSTDQTNQDVAQIMGIY